MRILIIDDEPDMALVLTDMLQRMGIESQSADTAETGLQLLPSFQPDAILLDVGLPGMSGFSALREFRARTKAPILIVSGAADSEMRVDALNLGAKEMLEKPIDFDRLKAAIRRLVQRP